MSEAWLVILLLGAGTYALKAAGPLLLGGRRAGLQREHRVNFFSEPLIGYADHRRLRDRRVAV